MWRLVEALFLLAIVLIFITEFLIPIITGKPLFGSFRKNKDNEKKEEKH